MCIYYERNTNIVKNCKISYNKLRIFQGNFLGYIMGIKNDNEKNLEAEKARLAELKKQEALIEAAKQSIVRMQAEIINCSWFT